MAILASSILQYVMSWYRTSTAQGLFSLVRMPPGEGDHVLKGVGISEPLAYQIPSFVERLLPPESIAIFLADLSALGHRLSPSRAVTARGMLNLIDHVCSAVTGGFAGDGSPQAADLVLEHGDFHLGLDQPLVEQGETCARAVCAGTAPFGVSPCFLDARLG